MGWLELCCRGYLAVRDHMDEVLALDTPYLTGKRVQEMKTMPCFKPHSLNNFKDRFKPDMTSIDASKHMIKRSLGSAAARTTKGYDLIQDYQQGIWRPKGWATLIELWYPDRNDVIQNYEKR